MVISNTVLWLIGVAWFFIAAYIYRLGIQKGREIQAKTIRDRNENDQFFDNKGY